MKGQWQKSRTRTSSITIEEIGYEPLNTSVCAKGEEVKRDALLTSQIRSRKHYNPMTRRFENCQALW
jgi:hypothetical protein